MALALGLSTAAHALDTAGQGVAQSILNTASSVTTVADGIRVNREAARRLAHRVDELVTVMAAEMQSRSLEDASEEWKSGVAVFKRSLDEAKDALLALSRRSHLAQLLHQKRDTEAIDRASENIQRAFDKLKIRAYLDIRARSAAVVQPLEQAKALRALEAQAKELELLASESSRAAAGSASRLPNAPPLFFGRDEEVIAIVRAITSPTGGNVAILGGPGMGKTSTAVTVLHHPVVAARFPARRYFVACDAIDGESGLLAAICTAVGVPAKDHNAAGAALATALRSSRSLVVLDNFETVWEASHLRTAAEDVLHLLSGIENLSLLITARGSERPQGVLWTKPALPPLGPLTTASAKQIFASIANVDDTDPHFLRLLGQLDNVPLAVTLLAHQAQFQLLDVLAARWDQIKTTLLARTAGGTTERLNSLDASIALSLGSPRMLAVEHSATILSLLAILPLGAVRTDVGLWSSQLAHAERALSTVLQCALAYQSRDDRIAVLSPIREYMLAHHPPPEDALRPLYAHYFQLANFEDQLFNPGPDVLQPVLLELDNLEHVIRYAFTNDTELSAALNAASWLLEMDVSDRAGQGSHDLLATALAIARASDLKNETARLLMTQAAFAAQGDWNMHQPGELFEEARSFYTAANNSRGVVESMLGLSSFLPLHEAIDICEQAQSVALAHHAQEELMAEVYMYLVRLYQRAGRTVLAQSYGQKAVGAARLRPESPYFLATCVFSLACLELDNNAVVFAMAGMEETISLSMKAGNSYLLGFAHFRLGVTLLSQGHRFEALHHLDAAFPHIKAAAWANHEIAYWRYLAQVHLLAGDEPTAAHAAQMAARFLQDHNASWTRGKMEVLHAHAHVLVWTSDFAGGRDALQAALQYNEDDRGNTGPSAVRYTRAQLLYSLGCLEKEAGCLEDSRNYLLVAVILHRREGKRTHTLEALASLSQVLGDDVAELMHQAVMLPLLRCGYLRDLAYVLLHSAKVALRGGQRGLALHRARSSVRMFTSLDCSHDLHKAMKTLSCMENLMSSIPS